MANVTAEYQITFTSSTRDSSIFQDFTTDHYLQVQANGNLSLEANRGNYGGSDARIVFANNGTTQGYFDNAGDLYLNQKIQLKKGKMVVLDSDGGSNTGVSCGVAQYASNAETVALSVNGGMSAEAYPDGLAIRDDKKLAFLDTFDTTIVAALDTADGNGSLDLRANAGFRVMSGANQKVTLANSGDGWFAGTVSSDGVGNFSAAGVRTKAAGGPPSGGSSGQLQVDTTGHKLWVNDGGTWKYVALT